VAEGRRRASSPRRRGGFQAARKAHSAIAIADLDALADRLTRSGLKPIWDDAIPNLRRFYISDPVGNRIEFVMMSAR
jgi:predicted enzyme related to lactoylglutathione lyase